MSLFKRALLQGANLPAKARQGEGFLDNVSIAVLTDAAQTLTVAQMSGGVIAATFTAGRILTTPTAAAIIAASPDMDIGDSFTIMVSMLAAFAATYAAGAGVTLAGRATTPASSNSTIVITRTGAATVQWYVL